MKANELMIGDWVEYSSKYKHGIGKIAGIEPREGSAEPTTFTVIDDNLMLIGVSKVNVKPVPLTPEILEKNGFDISDPEVKQYHFTEDGQKYHFTLRQMYNQEDDKPNGYSFYAFNVLTIIDYVHQLQHALKLCGIDKTIEL